MDKLEILKHELCDDLVSFSGKKHSYSDITAIHYLADAILDVQKIIDYEKAEEME